MLAKFLFFSVADDPWSFLDGHCYTVITGMVNSYDDAMETCAAYGGYVAATAIPAEINQINEIYSRLK